MKHFSSMLVAALLFVQTVSTNDTYATIMMLKAQQLGEAEFYSQLLQDRTQWNVVLQKMESGTDEWVSLAHKVFPFANNEQRAQLAAKIPYGLIHSSELLLPMLGQAFSVDQACTSPTPQAGRDDQIGFYKLAVAGVYDVDEDSNNQR